MRRLSLAVVCGLAVGCGGMEPAQSPVQDLGRAQSSILGTPGLEWKYPSDFTLALFKTPNGTPLVSGGAFFTTESASDLSEEQVADILHDGEQEILLARTKPGEGECIETNSFPVRDPNGIVLRKGGDVGSTFTLVSTDSPEATFQYSRFGEATSRSGFRYFPSRLPELSRIAPGTQWRLHLSGEQAQLDVSKIDGSKLTIPDYPVVTSPSLDSRILIDPTQPLEIRWEGAKGADSIRIQIGSNPSITCDARNTGRFTIPAAWLAKVPDRSFIVIWSERSHLIANAMEGRPHRNTAYSAVSGNYQIVR